MKPERWPQIEQLYLAALEREASERSDFLAQACAGDDELRREIESLLACQKEAEDFIEAPAVAVAAGLLADAQTQLATLSTGRKLGHYQVMTRLGAGGMGEVYLARDERLGRKVALKLLPARFTQDADRVRRFEQEARAASALNHPNILTIYEIGEVDGTHFIATEFVEGQTLRQRLTSGQMETNAVLEVALQVASALTAAHEAGIVHRDIKPENLMLRPDGFVKVLDFGLAKLTERPMQMVDTNAPTSLGGETDPGTVLGTVHYMSPEQARGLKVDARSDIFSLGIVLYEMIAGRRPFTGVTASDVLAAILQTEPTKLAQAAPTVPAELDRIITQALRKDCTARYQAIKDLQLDLKHLKQELEFAARQQRSLPPSPPSSGTVADTALPAPSEPAKDSTSKTASAGHSVSSSRKRRSRRSIDSLAILPLASASMDSQAEYLSDGITENVINRLSPLPKLKVMARSTVFRYKGREMDPQAVGRELGVRAVLTGRVLQLGDRVIIKTELVDVEDGTQIWGGQFNRQLTDLFGLEEDLSREISEQLQLKVGGQGKRSFKKRETSNPEAYEFYLKGNYYFHKASPEAMRKAIEYFQQAIAADPDYAQAHAGLAHAYLLASYTILSHREALPKAEQAAAIALHLNERLAEAHVSLAQVKMFKDWDWAGAETEFKRALELNPKNVDALDMYGRYLTWCTRFDEAIATMTRALELDPLSLAINTYLGMALFAAGQYDQAIKQCQKALELDPHCVPALAFLGIVHGQKGDYAAAIAIFQKQRQLNDLPITLSNLGYAYAVAGHRDEAQQLLDELQTRSRQRPVPSEYLALIYVGLGQIEEAFVWLERSYEEHSVLLPGWLNSDRRFDVLRSDPRFADLLRRVGITA